MHGKYNICIIYINLFFIIQYIRFIFTCGECIFDFKKNWVGVYKFYFCNKEVKFLISILNYKDRGWANVIKL